MTAVDNLVYLSEKHLEALGITADEVISSIEQLLKGQAASRVWNAPKSVLTPPDARYMMATLCAADDPPFMAVSDADLVISSVPLSSRIKPFLDVGWLKPGVFATITDAAVPWLPETMAGFDRIIIDDLQQEAQMDRPLVAPQLVSTDLGGLVNGEPLSRNTPEERTAFVFRGLGLGDLALAGLAYQRSRSQTIGATFSR